MKCLVIVTFEHIFKIGTQIIMYPIFNPRKLILIYQDLRYNFLYELMIKISNSLFAAFSVQCTKIYLLSYTIYQHNILTYTYLQDHHYYASFLNYFLH